jgi:hypothetical protein
LVNTLFCFGQQSIDPNIGIASNLYNRGDYERSTMFYSQLFNDNPNQPLYFERYVNGLIYTKKYDEASRLLKDNARNKILGQAIFFGGIHLKLSTNEKANILKEFDKTPVNWLSNPQFYFKAGQLLSEYRMYEEALSLYELGQEKTGIEGLFRNELSMTALQGGFYEEAVESFLSMIQSNPSQLPYVQRVWLRFGNDELFEEGVFKIEDILSQATSEDNNEALENMLLWCYQELEFYKKALFWAKKIEASTTVPNRYIVFNLANSLRSASEFDLAKEALQFYLNQPNHPIQEVALNALIDMEIAEINAFKISESFDKQLLRKSWVDLYNELDSMKELGRKFPMLMEKILLLQLRIDILELANHENKRAYVDSLSTKLSSQSQKELTTLSGILYLIDGDFRLARLDLSKAIRLKPAFRELDDWSAYYLGFSEWLNDQPEFAVLQLKRFKSENASYYSNDALELRRIIIEGKTSDSTYSSESKELITAKWLELKGEYANRDSLLLQFKEDENPVFWTAAIKQLLLNNYAFSIESLTEIVNKTCLASTDSPAKDEFLWTLIRYLERNTTQKTEILYLDWIRELSELLITSYPQSIYANSAREIFSKTV